MKKTVMVIGSMRFAKEMLGDVKSQLEAQGFNVVLPSDVEIHARDPTIVDDQERHTELGKEGGELREGCKRVSQAHCILIYNPDQNGVRGYIGPSTTMEIGVAYFCQKPIFYVYPRAEQDKWAYELDLIDAQCLYGSINSLSDHVTPL